MHTSAFMEFEDRCRKIFTMGSQFFHIAGDNSCGNMFAHNATSFIESVVSEYEKILESDGIALHTYDF